VDIQPLDSPPPDKPLDVVATDRACIRCSYNLRGLPTSGVCPECGTPVELSLRGYYLAFAAPEYVDSLRRGVTLVLNGILLYAVMFFGGFVLKVSLSSVLALSVRSAIWEVAMLLPTAMMLVGYWQFTRPDPSTIDREAPAAARRIVRIAIAIQGVTVAVGVLADLVRTGFSAPPTLLPAATIMSWLLGLASVGAWITQFFAVVIYVTWLARRIPDRGIVTRCGVYIWLLPTLFVILLPAVFIGPIIAIGLYWALLDRLRKHLRAIQLTGMPARFA
jgi:hypothetical protein